MNWQVLIETYGYLALLIGTFLEGETILVVAGFAAHQGYLKLPWVIVCAFAGTLVSDQLFFLLGHKKGRRVLTRWFSWEKRAQKVQALLDRYQVLVVLGFRFLYGLRNVTPFVIGASGFNPRRFLVLNILGAALWSVVVGCGGYLFGHVLETILQDFKKYELWALTGLIVGGLVLWVGSLIVRYRRQAQATRLLSAPLLSSGASDPKSMEESLEDGGQRR